MTPIPKKHLMARLRKRRKAAGLVQVVFWVPVRRAQEIRDVVAKRLKSRPRANKS